MKCEHRSNSICELATNLAKKYSEDVQIFCREDSLKACTECKCPHTLNYVSASLIVSELLKFNIHSRELNTQLFPIIRSRKECVLQGVGTNFEKILSYLGIIKDGRCNCEAYVKIMNEWGPTKCRRELNIILNWLEEESRNRKIEWAFNRSLMATLIIFSCQLEEGISWTNLLNKLLRFKNG